MGKLDSNCAPSFAIPQGWEVKAVLRIPARDGQWDTTDSLPLGEGVRNWLNLRFPTGIYHHQKLAVEAFLDGDNVAMSTGTGSGKTEAFMIAASEVLRKHAGSRVLVLYPHKALGREQEVRWGDFLAQSGAGATVGRIDGSVTQSQRRVILRNCRVIIATPDVIHASVLPGVGEQPQYRFWRDLRLVIVDEVHEYKGVFGSNSAFLFRRMRHACSRLGHDLSFFVSSATLADGAKHLETLFGVEFKVVGEDLTTSPRPELPVVMLAPPDAKDVLGNISTLCTTLAQHHDRFICFADSRKQVEYISAMSRRKEVAGGSRSHAPESDHAIGSSGVESSVEGDLDFDSALMGYEIQPYRAGYEEGDREAIERAFRSGKLNGIVSTSALELGLDIGDLTAVVLVGVPESGTSFRQRIGRIRPNAPNGTVYVVNDGSTLSLRVLENPPLLLERPFAEGALYLENRQIQYIHAMCLARTGGEDEAVSRALREASQDVGFGTAAFCSRITLPVSFMELCAMERTGETPKDLQSMKMAAGDVPHYVFPLRSTEQQFKVVPVGVSGERELGSLNWSQVMREAYPGAVYYHMAKPYRVVNVDRRNLKITVRRERAYFTAPTRLPVQIYPNLQSEGVHGGFRSGPLTVIESEAQVYQAITGFEERRGSTTNSEKYPTNKEGIRFTADRFTRTLFTTGVFVHWPSLDDPRVDVGAIARVFFLSLLIIIPFERQDLGCGVCEVKTERVGLTRGSKCLAVFDETYGSLRLSSVLAEPGRFTEILELCVQALKQFPGEILDEASSMAVTDLVGLLDAEPQVLSEGTVVPAAGKERVLCQGSRGVVPSMGSMHVRIQKVFYDPSGFKYRVCPIDNEAVDESVAVTIPADSVFPVPGEAEWGVFDYETGECVPDEG